MCSAVNRAVLSTVGLQGVDESLGISESDLPCSACGAGGPAKIFSIASIKKPLRHGHFRVLVGPCPLSRYVSEKICVRIVRVAPAKKSLRHKNVLGLHCNKSSKILPSKLF